MESQIASRVRQLRVNELNLRQNEFAAKINLTRSTIASFENGSRRLTDRVARDICRVYHVNLSWLMDGQGEVFQTDGTEWDILKDKYDLNDDDIAVIKTYTTMGPEKRQFLREIIKDFSAK